MAFRNTQGAGSSYKLIITRVFQSAFIAVSNERDPDTGSGLLACGRKPASGDSFIVWMRRKNKDALVRQ